QGRRRARQPAGLAGARQISQCRGQGDRRAGEFEPTLSLSQHPQIHAADRRSVRARAHLLGHRHHPHAVFVAPKRDDVYRGDAVAQEPRPRTRHGPRAVRLARLEITRLRGCFWLAIFALSLSGFVDEGSAAGDGPALDALVRAYPEQLAGYDPTYLIWRDGTRMPLSDGQP